MTEFIVSLIVLAIFGIYIAGYLIYKRTTKKPLVCPVGGDCEAVVSSKYGKTFGVKNDLTGILYYIFILVLALHLGFFQGFYPLWAKIITFLAFLFSVYLVYIQARVLKQYCFYCLTSAVINLLILLNVLVL